MSRLQTVLAWIAAIAALTSIQFAASYVGSKVGVPVFLDVDPYTVHYGRGAEVERDSITTTYGWGTIIVGILAAVAAWHVVKGKPFTREGRGYFFCNSSRQLRHDCRRRTVMEDIRKHTGGNRDFGERP